MAMRRKRLMRWKKFSTRAALAVGVAVERAVEMRGLGGDDDLAAALAQRLDQASGAVGRVAHDVGVVDVAEQLVGDAHLVRLPGSQSESDGVAEGVDEGVELGRRPAARAPNLLRAPLFRAPDASWCARTMVASMRKPSSSCSWASSSSRRCRTPDFDQREKRV